MSNKPIIGIVGRSDRSTEGYNTICCFESIRRSIIKKGGIPILILPNQDLDYDESVPSEIDALTQIQKNELIKLIDLCDGIIIPGTYKLFEYDKIIYQYAYDKDIPMLCICGGMQLMGLVDNNSLSEETLIENNTLLNHFQKGKKFVHNINIVENTLLGDIIKETKIKVNSRHNYHLEKITSLKICAYSEDGLIEALEVPNKKFILGVQWHPESMLEYDENSNKIYDAFIHCCKN